jgi:hypothetical protein
MPAPAMESRYHGPMLEKRCLQEGCEGYPMYGYQPSSKVPMKWACPKHKHLLQQDAPEPRAIIRDVDLFDA